METNLTDSRKKMIRYAFNFDISFYSSYLTLKFNLEISKRTFQKPLFFYERLNSNSKYL